MSKEDVLDSLCYGKVLPLLFLLSPSKLYRGYNQGSWEWLADAQKILRHPPPQTPNPSKNALLPQHPPRLRIARHPLRLHAPRKQLPPPRQFLRRLLERIRICPRLNRNLHLLTTTTLPAPLSLHLLDLDPKSRYPSNATMAATNRMAKQHATGTIE